MRANVARRSIRLLTTATPRSDTHLYEEPRRDERQAAVLSAESVMVRVEGEVVQVKKSETETARLVRSARRRTSPVA